jgi:hypothetical protein
MFDVGPVLVHRQRFGASCDVLKADWHIIPDIDASVDAVARAFPVVVDMTEDLERVTPGMVPGNHGVVTERVRLLLRAVANLG